MHTSREHSFRWRRSLPGKTAPMESSEYVTLPAAEVTKNQHRSLLFSRDIRSWRGRGIRLVPKSYSLNYRAHVASGLFSQQRYSSEKQQQAGGCFPQKQDQHRHASMPSIFSSSTLTIPSLDQFTRKLQVQSFPGAVGPQEGREDGVPHEVFSRVRMSSGNDCRCGTCEISEVGAGMREDAHGGGSIEIKSRHRKLVGKKQVPEHPC